MSLVGWLLFFATLGLLIFVHEMGHFLAAKSVGVTVEEFAFGFGPKLLTLLKRGGTEYTVRALPLGGFVSMIGMQPEEVEIPNGLMSKPAWARAWVFVAGPLMNLILALLVFCSMGMITGVPDKRSTQVVQVVPNSEAERVGLRTGDTIVAIDGEPITDGTQLIKVIRSHPGQQLRIAVRRGSEMINLTATPKPGPDEANPKVTIGLLGFQPGITFKRLGFQASVKTGLSDLAQSFVFMGRLLRRPAQLKDAAGGPISILRVSQMNAQLGPGYHFGLVGQLSLGLAVFNLLPIPVLDGGHLALLLVEVCSGLFWRRRLGPEVYRVATAVGLVFIVGVFLLLTYSDLIKWITHKML